MRELVMTPYGLKPLKRLNSLKEKPAFERGWSWRNLFKYVCEDCGATQYVGLLMFERAARPRCMNCGSVRLEPVTSEAKDRLKVSAAASKDYYEHNHSFPSMS